MLDRIRIQYCCARFREFSTQLMGDTSAPSDTIYIGEIAHERRFLLRVGRGLYHTSADCVTPWRSYSTYPHG